MKKTLLLLVAALLVVALVPVSAHDAPTVEVSDQVSVDGMVVIDHVTSDGPGFIVIHIDNGGAPGPVAGYAHVDGENDDVHVHVDPTMVTPVLYAMLHVDDNEIGVYEFGTVEGADAPVMVDGAPVTPAFNVQLIHADPQLAAGEFTAHAVVTDAAGWLVIHSGVDGAPGPVLGAAPVVAGNNANVVVTLEGEATPTVFPMLHVDTGEAGVYEFGTVEGADAPVAVNGVVAVVGVSTVPTVIAEDQLILHGENHMEEMSEMAPTLTATVLSQGPSFLVVHQDNAGAPGPVAGVAPLVDGLNENVVVELDPALVTPVLWPMLHVDDGEAGVYEFGTVEGADAPVVIDGAPVMIPVNVAPSFRASTQSLTDGHVVIDSALIDAEGWMVIHSSVDGAPGPVVGYVKLQPGHSHHIMVPVDLSSVEGAATDQVFPMLHYDTGEVGVYEFGTVEGADAPVMFGGAPVVGPLTLE